MTLALWLVVLSPVVAATIMLALPEGPSWGYVRRWIAALGFEAAIGGAILMLLDAVRVGPVVSRSFAADPWRAGLVLAILLVSSAGTLRLAKAHPSDAADARRIALVLAATAASVCSVLATDALVFGAALFVTTLTFGALAFAAGDRAAARATAWLVFSDICALVGLLWISSGGVRLPVDPAGVGGILLLIAALVRGGLAPGTRWLAMSVERGAASSTVAFGGMRAQAVLLAAMVARAHGDAATALAMAAAVLGALAARRAALDGSPGAAQVAVTGLVLAAFGMGAATALAGAVLLLAGAFIATMLVLLGREHDAGAPSVGAAPAGAVLPGAVVVVVTLADFALIDRLWMIAAIPAVMTLVWLAAAGVAGFRGAASGARAHPAWALLALGGVAVIAFLPARAMAWIVHPVLPALGAVPPLGETPGLPEGAGLAFAAAVVALMLTRVPGERRAHPPAPPVEGTLLVPTPMSLRLAVAGAVVAVGCVIALAWVGVRLGFL